MWQLDLNNYRIEVENKNYYRLHSKRYFREEPEWFFYNFLESGRTFSNQCRFAPKKCHSGFYLGKSIDVALSEIFYYNQIPHIKNEKHVDSLCRLNKLLGKDYVLLEVNINMKDILNYTEVYLVHGLLYKFVKIPAEMLPVDVLSYIATIGKGGSAITDYLGHIAKEGKFNGAIFPSVRAVNNPNITDNFGYLPSAMFNTTFRDLITREEEHSMGIETFDTFNHFVWDPMTDDGRDNMEMFLKENTNLVVFSASKLMSNIKEFSWIDAEKGKSKTYSNPYYGFSPVQLELIRINEKTRLAMSDQEAYEMGLITDSIIEKELTKSFM